MYWTKKKVKKKPKELIKVALHSEQSYKEEFVCEKKEEQKEKKKCRSYDSEFTGRERRKSNGYMDKCVRTISCATLGGKSDHHRVFLYYYLTVCTTKKTARR